MGKITVFILAVVLSGCAHQTIHKYCLDNERDYRSYDQCYSERLNELSQPSKLSAWGSFLQGLGAFRREPAQIQGVPQSGVMMPVR